MASHAYKNQRSFRLRCSCYGHEQDVRAVAALSFPVGSFVSGSRDATARVWAPNKENYGFSERLVTSGHNNFISAVCVLPANDKYPHAVILTGSNDHDILAYTIDSPQPIYRLSGHSDAVCSLSASKFGSVVSGSWDKTAKVWLKEKCAMTLRGHEAAVRSVVILSEKGYMLTGSADKNIKLWRAGRCEKTFQGHSDCVRGLAVLNSAEFLSCSNDATVRRWNISGECIKIFYGHSNYIYSIATLLNGVDFVTCSEDWSLRFWSGASGVCVQTIVHPAQSVWTVSVLANGDVVTGASDGVIRVFTSSSDRYAEAAEQAAFTDSVAISTIPAQIGDIKTNEHVGPDALLSPGKQDGQTVMIGKGYKVEPPQWDASIQSLIKIGDIAGGSGGSQASSILYEGKGKPIGLELVKEVGHCGDDKLERDAWRLLVTMVDKKDVIGVKRNQPRCEEDEPPHTLRKCSAETSPAGVTVQVPRNIREDHTSPCSLINRSPLLPPIYTVSRGRSRADCKHKAAELILRDLVKDNKPGFKPHTGIKAGRVKPKPCRPLFENSSQTLHRLMVKEGFVRPIVVLDSAAPLTARYRCHLLVHGTPDTSELKYIERISSHGKGLYKYQKH